jgi:hypothetical protein
MDPRTEEATPPLLPHRKRAHTQKWCGRTPSGTPAPICVFLSLFPQLILLTSDQQHIPMVNHLCLVHTFHRLPNRPPAKTSLSLFFFLSFFPRPQVVGALEIERTPLGVAPGREFVPLVGHAGPNMCTHTWGWRPTTLRHHSRTVAVGILFCQGSWKAIIIIIHSSNLEIQQPQPGWLTLTYLHSTLRKRKDHKRFAFREQSYFNCFGFNEAHSLGGGGRRM